MSRSKSIETDQQTDSSETRKTRRCLRHSWFDWITLFSGLFVPLIVGVLTVVLPLQQSNLNEQQQENSKLLAMNSRIHDLEVLRDQQKQAILNNFEQDLSNLLLKYKYLEETIESQMENDSETDFLGFKEDEDDRKLSKIIRTKTLNAIRQLDPARKILLIQLLIDSSILNRVNLSQADLSSSIFPPGSRYFHLQFSRLVARNMSLKSVSIFRSDFTHSVLDGSSFQQSNCSFTDFSYASLQQTDWTNADITQAVFNYSNLSGAKVTLAQLATAKSIEGAILPNGSHHAMQYQGFRPTPPGPKANKASS